MMRALVLLMLAAITVPSWPHPTHAQQPPPPAAIGQQGTLDAATRSIAQRLGYCAAFFKTGGEPAQQFPFAGLLSQADATRFLLWFYFSASTAIPDQWRQPYEAGRQHGARDAVSATADRIADVYRFCKPVTPSASVAETKPALTTPPPAADRLPAASNAAMVRKLRRCWQVAEAGSAGSPPVVHVIVDMAEDGRATDVKLDADTQARLAGNARLRAFAAAALRAVLDPRCQPLPYPRDRYDQFRRFVLTLDPGEWH